MRIPVVVALLMLSSRPIATRAADDKNDRSAIEAFEAGRFQQALDIYAKLYSQTLHPTYLRNIGRCYQKLNEPDRAIDAFRSYLEKASHLPKAKRQEVLGYIKEMEQLRKSRAASAVTFPVTVVVSGTGGGKVTSTTDAFACSAGTCAASYPKGARLGFVAAPNPSSTFTGWSGICSGERACAVTVDGPRELVAKFMPQNLISTPALATARGNYLGVKAFGGKGNDNGFAVAADQEGNLLVTGSFQETVSLGGAELKSAGLNDIFVAKFSRAGAHLWSRQLGNDRNDFGKSIAVDRDGSAYVTGSIEAADKAGTIGEDIFLAKYSPKGVVLWGKRFGSSGSDVGHSVAIDGHGNPVITGEFAGTVDFGGGPLVAIRHQDIFVAKYGASGTHIWSKAFGSDGQDAAYAIGTTDAAEVCVAGILSGAADFGGGAMKSMGGEDAFLLKLAADGSFGWSRLWGGPGNDSANALRIDSFGQIVVTGDFRASADFGGGVLASAGGQDVFAVKYSAGGGHIWSARFGGPEADVGRGLAVDQDGNFAITGSFGGALDFGTGPLRAAGPSEGFLAKFSPKGAALWARRFGGPGSDFGFGTSADPEGNVAVTGIFQKTADIGGQTLTSRADGFDVFLLRIGP